MSWLCWRPPNASSCWQSGAGRRLDVDLRPLPAGTAGELWLAGEDEAAQAAELAPRGAETWRPDPFAEQPGQRLRQAGERARWTARGTLQRLPRLEVQPRSRGPAAEPTTTTELALLALWEELLPARPIGVDDSFFDLGGHSLLAVRLTAEVRRRFGRPLPLAELFTSGGTIRGLARALAQDAAAVDSPLVPLRPVAEGAVRTRPPFYCVHPTGGRALSYQQLVRQLPPEQPFFAFQARGVDSDQPPLETVEELAESYVEALVAAQPRGPYHLGGWSFGGLVAFEMARQLRAADRRVGALVMLDTTAPELMPEPDPEEENVAGLLAGFAAQAGLAVRVQELQPLSTTEQLARVAELAVAAGLLPEVGAEWYLRRRLTVFRANLRALRRYRPGGYPGRVTLLKAQGNVPEPDAGPHTRAADYGWGSYAGAVTVLPVPGTHLNLLHPPHVGTVAEVLEKVLVAAGETGGV